MAAVGIRLFQSVQRHPGPFSAFSTPALVFSLWAVRNSYLKPMCCPKFSVLVVLMILAGPAMAVSSVTPQQWIQDHVAGYEEPFTLTVGGKPLRVCPALVTFYRGRDYQPAWTDGRVPLPRANQLIQALKAATREGLNPADYQTDRVEAALAELLQPRATIQSDPKVLTTPAPIPPGGDPTVLAELDVLLSQTFMHYASHLGGWRVDQPNNVDSDWFVKRPFLDLSTTLTNAVASDQIEETLFKLLPQHPGYTRLREALARYRGLAAVGGWPRISNGPKLQIGSRGVRVAALRARLAAEGLLPATRGSDVFDDGLRQAVKTFLRTHGQEPSGVVGPAALEALNLPVEERIRQIEVNLERWRWLPRDLGKNHIMVNVAGYELEVVDDAHTVMSMRVVVGKPYLRTPAFSAEMSYLVLNPYWNVPPTIAGKEILPELRKNPDYLTRHNMELSTLGAPHQEINPAGVDWSRVSAGNFPYRLRQRPGLKNPLGTVKFMFPNQFNVYLHDTSQRNLFARTERVFSHGCIRVEKPIELMEYVLGAHSRWNRNTVKELDSQRERIIGIPQPIPVHILYWTAWVDEEGNVQFRKDVYGRDKLLDATRGAGSSVSSIGVDSNTSNGRRANHPNVSPSGGRHTPDNEAGGRT
ncbi:L,D-transpeptidase YcbB [Gammaproteobacteria bacterium]